jgi:hypothetical protein
VGIRPGGTADPAGGAASAWLHHSRHAQRRVPRVPASLWWPWSLLGALIALAAGYYGVRISARLGTILGVFEITVFVVLAEGLRRVHHRHRQRLVGGPGPAPLAPPLSYMGPGVAVWIVLGVIYLLYLYARDPRRVTEVGLVHLDADVADVEAGAARADKESR